MPEETQTTPQAQRVIWFVLTASIPLYALVAWLVVPTMGGARPPLPAALPLLCYGLAAVLAVVAILLHLRGPAGPRGLILSLSLSESIAVLGLALAFVTARRGVMLPFAGVAFLLNAWFYPRDEE